MLHQHDATEHASGHQGDSACWPCQARSWADALAYAVLQRRDSIRCVICHVKQDQRIMLLHMWGCRKDVFPLVQSRVSTPQQPSGSQGCQIRQCPPGLQPPWLAVTCMVAQRRVSEEKHSTGPGTASAAIAAPLRIW